MEQRERTSGPWSYIFEHLKFLGDGMGQLLREHCESCRAFCEFLEYSTTLVDLQDRMAMKVLKGDLAIYMDLMC